MAISYAMSFRERHPVTYVRDAVDSANAVNDSGESSLQVNGLSLLELNVWRYFNVVTELTKQFQINVIYYKSNYY